METFLVVGLGNPGSRYANTRHIDGTDFVQMLCEKYGVELTEKKKYKASIGKFLLKDMEVILSIPTLFMNQSGKSVAPTIKGENIKLKNLLVVHDDLDLPPRVSKLKFSGGDGGHNGLKDIMQSLSGKKDFKRLRIGIGHPGDTKKVNSFVVKKGSSSERKNKLLAMHNALEVFELVAFDDWEKALTQLHSKK